jgi:hypothetical protein
MPIRHLGLGYQPGHSGRVFLCSAAGHTFGDIHNMCDRYPSAQRTLFLLANRATSREALATRTALASGWDVHRAGIHYYVPGSSPTSKCTFVTVGAAPA